MNKTLVAYFSCSGVTQKLAKTLASVVGGDIYQIQPAVAYTDADLDWTDTKSRSSIEMKDKNSTLHPGEVRPSVKHKARYQLGYALPRSLSFRTILDFVAVRMEGEPASYGYMFSQQLAYRFQQVPLELSVHYFVFDTDDYASRLTIYERGMLYAFSFPSFHGKGVRSSLYARYDFNRHFTAVVKIYRTHYRHPSVEVPYSTRSGIDCQLRVKF